MIRQPSVRVILRLCLTMVGSTGCRNQAATEADRTGLPGSPDQVATGVSMALNDPNGLRQALVTADSALIFQQEQRIEFRRVSVVVFDQRSDQASTLTARRGTYSVQSGILEAAGEVSVTTDHKGRLTTPRLTFDPRRLQFRNDTSYVWDAGAGTPMVTGRKLVTDVRLNGLRAR